MSADGAAYEALCFYTLSLGDAAFIHQHVVDAYAAQTADENTKPIKLNFALIGLYLHAEKKFTGREVQRAHVILARGRKQWSSFPLPDLRGSMTAADVAALPAGEKRDEAIHAWCVCVCEAYRDSHGIIRETLKEFDFA